MTTPRTLLAILAATALATLLAGCNEKRDPGFQGWVEADMIFVSPDESGRVTKLNVREGDEVKQGDQLYSVDDDLQKADLNQNKATLANAQQSYDRAASLRGTGAGTQATLDSAVSALRVAEARVVTSETRLARRQGYAPVAGTIQQIYFREGEMVPAQRPVLSIMPPGNMKLRFFVPEAELPKLAIGDVVRVTCDNCGADLTAKIYFIATTAEYTPPVIYSLDERNKLVYLIQARPARPDALRVGQPISVYLNPKTPGGQAMNGGAPIAIDVKGLTKSFEGREVVHELSMQVKRGSIYGFLGPNGSGKTTTIRMLCGLLTPDRGEGTCLGYDIRRDADKIKRQVGYMTQRFSLYQDLSVRENLEFVARLYGVSDARGTAREMIKRLGLSGREEQLAGELSGGWKQRLALGACTLPNPQLLLLDEPTAGVDPKARRDFWNEIHTLAGQGLTVLVSTHYMDEAERCHEIAYIAYGHLLAHGTVDEVIAKSALTTYTVTGDDLQTLSEQLAGQPGIDMVAPFGTSLHVSGRDQAALESTIAPWRDKPALHWQKGAPSLEDVFIELMGRSKDNFQ
jgi:ABC-2 type transport system ATP-binding protein